MRFFHFLGVALWIGGAIAAFTVARSIGSQPAEARRIFWPHVARIHALVIGPGAMLTVITGVLLTMSLVNRGMTEVMARPGIIIMQGAGIIAAVIALFVGVPTANQLGALGRGDDALGSDGTQLAARLRKRQAIASSVAGVLTLVALFAGAVIK
jgi:uncharacterized membrane protein